MEPSKKSKKLNPLDKGVSYKEFSKALGKTKIEDYLKGVCSSDEIKWLKTELVNFKNNKNGS